MSTPDDVGVRVAQEMAVVFKELPGRLNVVSILRDVHARLVVVAPDAPPELVAEKIVDVLREIAAHAVEEFTRRTGQPFLWVDDPQTDEPSEPLMSFGLDDKGNVVF